MKKPELVITKWLDDIPVAGKCSSCPDEGEFEIASTNPTVEGNKKTLNEAFMRHFKKIHLHEDASQAAVRIVREATDNS